MSDFCRGAESPDLPFTLLLNAAVQLIAVQLLRAQALEAADDGVLM